MNQVDKPGFCPLADYILNKEHYLNRHVIDWNDIPEELRARCKACDGVMTGVIKSILKAESGNSAGERDDKNPIISSNPEIKRITDIIKRIAPFDATVLLTGESGAGKNHLRR